MSLEVNLNNLNQAKFVSLFGVIFEKTQWIAEKLFELKPFKNKNDLIKILGAPSTTSDFNKNIWFYFERLKTNQSIIKLGAQKIKRNNILIVKLDNKGILKSKELLDLNDMNDIKYIKTVTTKEFKNNNLIYGIFSSLREKINAPLRNR